jgi:endonuclease III
MNRYRRNISFVNRLLEETYHSPRLGNKKKPLNELLYIQLSLRTTGPSFERVYKEFKKRFPRWIDVCDASQTDVAKALFNAGLSNQKAANLKSILRKLKQDFGRISLAPLSHKSDEEIEDYLCSLPGVGIKSARCIMLYSINRHVFPVDGHCFRIVKRLGWIKSDSKNNDKTADKIQKIISPDLRYSLHVNMVAHGRAICLDRFPKCKICPLLITCPFGKVKKRRGKILELNTGFYHYTFTNLR